MTSPNSPNSPSHSAALPVSGPAPFYIGLMSGTSLDGVDGVVAQFSNAPDADSLTCRTLATAYQPFTPALRADLMALQTAGENEIEREALAANALAECYANCVTALLAESQLDALAICAIGAHGQTIRHRPELGYTRQTNNPARLAELTGIDVVADFRSRDIAAGGQGAPLVPAFHQAVFGQPGMVRVVVNIGGIGNISVLQGDGGVRGFDTGPGNLLLDAWVHQHHGKHYDAEGAWGASGIICPALLTALRSEPYLALTPPKSTGRDLFNPAWLVARLSPFAALPAADVQATLAAFTASTIADAINAYAGATREVYVCGGGAYNKHLMRLLAAALPTARVTSCDALGVAPNQVEALAFAWLAQRFVLRQAGNLPAVTGAKGLRILGALYPCMPL